MGVLAGGSEHFYLAFSTKLSFYFQYIRSCMCNPIMLVYHNLYLIFHIFAHIFFIHVEVGGMWKYLVFPQKYFYKHSSEQLSRQAAWATVMCKHQRPSSAIEIYQYISMFCFKCSHFSYYVEVGGMCEQLGLPEMLLQTLKSELVQDNRISAEIPSMLRREQF